MRQLIVAARFSFFIVLSLVAVSGVAAFGQENSGILQGVVSDESGAVLPAATVTLTNKFTNREIVTTTGAYGNYSVRNIEPGTYSVTVQLSGFTKMEFPDIGILVAQTLKLDARMKAGGPTTNVQVTDVVPLIDVQSTLVALAIPQQEFDRLPKSRTFQHLAVLSPGVNVGEIEGGIQVHGASSAENAYLIDGIAITSAIDGRSRQNATFEYLQEVQIKTGGVDAEYSGALGGVISTVTKSGGNSFHGSGWLYYSGSKLNAAPPKRLVLDPRDDRTVAYFQDEKNEFRAFEPGFSLGGPIKKERLFFFSAWGPRWARQDQLYHFNNGAETGVIQREQTFMSGFNKLSFEPSARVRSNFTWLWTPAKGKGTLPVYNGACPNCLSSTAAANAVNNERGSFAPQSSYSANIDIVATNNFLISSRASYFWDNYKDTGIPNTTSVQYQTPAVGPLVPANFQGGVGFQNTPRLLIHDHDRVARASAQVDVSILGNLGGFHNLKAGAGLEKTVNDVNRYYPGGYVLVWWDRTFTSPVTSQPGRGQYGYYEVNDFRTLGSTASGMKSLYVQDQWRVHERFTLNFGVRMEHERVPSFRRDIQDVAIDFGWKDRIAPRIGAGYDVYGDGKLKLSGSWGRYYDWTKYSLARSVFGGEIWRTYYRSLDTPSVFTLSLSNMPGQDLWNPGVTAFRDRRSPFAGLESVDPDLKPMSQDQWTFGADYQRSSRTVIGARYIHQVLRRAVEDLAVRFQGNDAYIYANPGEGIASSAPFTTGRTARPLLYPKPVRDYDAVEIAVRKRFFDNWFGNLSYTWSRLYGNYAGLASSDEILTPTTGLSFSTAQQPGGSIANTARYANRGWDLDEVLFDSKGTLDPKGPLATDRPHVFKFSGGYEFDLGSVGSTSVGTFFYLGSGTPLSTLVNTRNSVPVFVNGRGDMGRTPVLNYTDLQIAHSIDLADTQTVRVELNILNAFNQQTSRHRFDNLNRGAGIPVASSAIDLSNVDLRSGYDYTALINATSDGANALDPRYGKDDLFSEGLSARFALKWSF